MYSKPNKRREAIRALIDSQSIENQKQLSEKLKEQYNLDIHQSIISRDLYELGVIKRRIRNKMVYEISKIDAVKEILRLSVLQVDHNENLIVIKVLPGLAAFVGDYLDSKQEEAGVLGTIAGENMIFATPSSVKQIKKTYQKICEILYSHKQDKKSGLKDEI